jgi:hypothetical protein
MALKTAAPLFFKSTPGLEKEGNWQAFKEGTPGNLKLLDGLISLRPHDTNLLVPAIKGYAGYGFVVHETLFLDDKWSEKEKSIHREQALAYYSQAWKYGLEYLKQHGVSYKDLQEAVKKDGISGLLEDKLGDDLMDLEGVLFSAQALGSLINLQRQKMLMVAQLPIVKGMFDWACGKKPDLAHGTCMIFYGSYEAGRPKMLGGNPEKGRKIFENAIKAYPHNWLIRMAFIEHYIIPMSDEDLFLAQKLEFEKYVDWFEDELIWRPDLSNRAAFKNERLRLFQSVAVKRFNIVKKYQEDLF